MITAYGQDNQSACRRSACGLQEPVADQASAAPDPQQARVCAGSSFGAYYSDDFPSEYLEMLER